MRQKIYQWVLYYLRFFARLALFIHRPAVIGITGSVGKTSAAEAAFAMLKDHFPTKTIKKYNSEIGIPLGILGLEIKTNSFFDWVRLLFLAPFKTGNLSKLTYLLVEMGVDEPDPPKNMEYLLTIVKPQICVFLNVHPVHLQQFERSIPHILDNKKLTSAQKKDLILKRIAEEKGKLLTKNPNCKKIIYNSDNAYVRDVVNMVRNSDAGRDREFFSFGEGKQNTISFDGYDINLGGTSFDFKYNQSDEKATLKFKKYLMPQVYEETFAAALLIGEAVGIPPEKAAESLIHNYEHPEGRSSLFEGIKGSIIIDSSYNASKAPTLAFLELLEVLKQEQKRPTVFLFGDMRELGERAAEEHKEVAEHIAGTVTHLYCVGPLTQKYVVPKLEKYLDEVKWFPDAKQAGEYLKKSLPAKALVLVKGSQNTIFLEEAIKFILKDRKDELKLCRQDEFWTRKKVRYFSSLENPVLRLR